jgi:membrane protein implicated in regulation of membrane protease activity
MAMRPTKADAALKAGEKPEGLRLSAVEIIAGALSLVWLAAAALFFLILPTETEGGGFDTMGFVMTLLAVFLPIAVIWVAAIAMRSARIVREESRRLQAAIDAMRQTYVADRQARGAGGMDPTVEKKLNEIAKAAQKTETALATFTSARPAQAATRLAPAPKPEPGDDQPTLALGTSAEDMTPPIQRSDLVRALNFPDTQDDEVGFAALRRALKDHSARQLIQASQDVLTLLSQDGIYMDDLRPDRARPEFWRRFARGERGKAVAALGGVRDRSSLALTAGRMREDTIFRDAAHHFLRKFDQMLESFEPEASDEDIAALAETRTARAFMLLGRVTGAFD